MISVLFPVSYFLLPIIGEKNLYVLDNTFFSLFERIHEEKVIERVVVVDFDEESVEELGGWPLQPEMFISIIESINDKKAKIIGIPILFLEKSAFVDYLTTNVNSNLVLGYLSESPGNVLCSINSHKFTGRCGYLDVLLDKSGTVLGYFPHKQQDGKHTYSFSCVLYSLYNPSDNSCLKKSFIGYKAFGRNFQRISVKEITNENVQLEGKVVVIGTSFIRFSDRNTSSGRVGYGTLYASQLSDLVNQEEFQYSFFLTSLMASICFLGGLILRKYRRYWYIASLIILSVVSAFYGWLYGYGISLFFLLIYFAFGVVFASVMPKKR